MYPIGAQNILSNCYVDDVIFSSHDTAEATLVAEESTKLLVAGHFPLVKWHSNNIEALLAINKGKLDDNTSVQVEWNAESSSSVLGVKWLSGPDLLTYKYECNSIKRKYTKRHAASAIASLFDPLGLVSPVIVRAKCHIQEMCKVGVGWDQPLSDELLSNWKEIENQLPLLANIKIPRWIGYTPNAQVQLIGFADASTKAYAAAVYLRISNQNKIVSHLMTSKTRVAPLKTITVPRLELCAAVLLCELMNNVYQSSKLAPSERDALFVDSMIALHWIKTQPAISSTFVSHRVADIQAKIPIQRWRHVGTNENPADLASRGCSPMELEGNVLWWEGPSWLRRPEAEWPTQPKELSANETPLMKAEIKKSVTSSNVIIGVLMCDEDGNLNSKFPLGKTLRITAYMRRVFTNKKAPLHERRYGPIQHDELIWALEFWIRREQQLHFSTEIACIKKGNSVSKSSQLSRLCPFIDAERILRVRGRIENSSAPFHARHPIILPTKSYLSRIIVDDIHKIALHGGIQLMLQILRSRYWIVHDRKLVKWTRKVCVKCWRYRRQSAEQLMGSLPDARVNVSPPFSRCGIDYAGPISLKAYDGRCKKIIKGYLALFVCLATRAIHIEVVSTLSSEAFLAAFNRFCADKGGCIELWSDNATNFIGAYKQLRDDLRIIFRSWLADEILNAMALRGTTWKFISPASPHQGGIWEAAIKSAKYHLSRILGGKLATFEELNTVTKQIAACLNSRPIVPISDDIEDGTALTPGHFVAGRQIILPLSKNFLDEPSNRLRRWQMLQQMVQQFWICWKKDFLATLQQRTKWRNTRTNVKIGDLALITDENAPPSVWPMGRIIATQPGQDGLVRNVTLRCPSGNLQRSVQKICVLPSVEFELEQESQSGRNVRDCAEQNE